MAKTKRSKARKPGTRTGAKANPKHPTATYPRAKLKLPKGVDPQRKRAAPRGKKNTSDGPLFDSVRASAAASLAAEEYERKAAKARAKAKAAGKKNPKGKGKGKKNTDAPQPGSPLFAFELAALYDKAVQLLGPKPNWLGFLRRVPNQKYYREPPRGMGGARVSDAPSAGELRAFRDELALAVARASSGKWWESGKRNAGKGKVKRPKPVSKLTAKDFAPISKMFVKYRDLFAKTYPNVRHIGLMVDSSVHDTKRHFAMTGTLPVGHKYPRPGPVPAPTVRIAPELAFEPTNVQRGIIVHEIAHSVFLLQYKQEPKGYDANERATDKLAEEVTGLKIYYDKRGVEVAGKGAKGVRPRPDGLR